METFLDQLQYHVVAFVINSIGAILLVRIYIVKQNSRFLLHLAIAFGIIGLAHLLDAGITTLNLFPSLPTNDFKRFAEKIDLLLSCLSTFFFVLSFILLMRYPDQTLPRDAYIATITVFGLFVAVVTLIQGPADDSVFLKAIDIITSVIGIICVGLGLVRIASGHMSSITGWIAASAYCLWALAQVPFWFDYIAPSPHEFYFYSLTIISLVTAIATVIFCAITLPDRPVYRTNHPNPTQG
jgi:hypothetical protein